MAVTLSAQELAGSQVQIDNKTVSMGRGAQVLVGMDVTVPADMKLTTNGVLTLTPMMVAADESANKALPAIHVYGRTRQIVAQRTGKLPEDAFEVVQRDNGTAQTIHYTARVPFEKWMNGADLKMFGQIHGCANCLKEENLASIFPIKLERYVVKPAVAFIEPQVEVKNRAEEGRAFLDFPVNQTTIYPEYRKNPRELAEIKRTIDVVNQNEDTEITGISIHGYASPEGSYATNTRLAQGRAEALKKYVMQEYGLEGSKISVQSTPEDWAGFRALVEKSDLANKAQILEIMNDEYMNYDAKDMRIRSLDAQTGKFILEDWYPALRHSDYVVNYVVRPYNLEEAKELLKKKPQMLSLEEMYRVSQTYEKGSNEFNEVFDIAVRMYPHDPIANINAAAMELMQGGHLPQAFRYLERADANAPATQNNWGVYYLLKGDLDKAETYLKKAQSMGVAQAAANLEELAKKREDNANFGEE